jgi:pSer/pThr/pTyr-binding forkhead associated (FHA) protein
LLLLHVLDDGESTGEVIRVRKTPFAIGRNEGDLTFPLDSQMSGRHASLGLEQKGGRVGWAIRDLDSTNGTFVRAAQVVLHDGQGLQIGSKRFRMVCPQAAAAAIAPQPATAAWRRNVSQMIPRLVEINPEAEPLEILLSHAEFWIGRDQSQCAARIDDPMVSPRHARVYQDQRQRWCIENAGSLNGVWAQITNLELGKGGEFQCGEQRFVAKIF